MAGLSVGRTFPGWVETIKCGMGLFGRCVFCPDRVPSSCAVFVSRTLFPGFSRDEDGARRRERIGNQMEDGREERKGNGEGAGGEDGRGRRLSGGKDGLRPWEKRRFSPSLQRASPRGDGSATLDLPPTKVFPVTRQRRHRGCDCSGASVPVQSQPPLVGVRGSRCFPGRVGRDSVPAIRGGSVAGLSVGRTFLRWVEDIKCGTGPLGRCVFCPDRVPSSCTVFVHRTLFPGFSRDEDGARRRERIGNQMEDGLE